MGRKLITKEEAMERSYLIKRYVKNGCRICVPACLEGIKVKLIEVVD